MATGLLDINVRVALTWPTPIHHRAARRGFDRRSAAGWATCPITPLGFIRLSSNPKIIRDAVSPRKAVAVLARLPALPGHEFQADTITPESGEAFASLALIGHRQVTDAYLLSLVLCLARSKGGRRVTLDRGIGELICDAEERRAAIECIDLEA